MPRPSIFCPGQNWNCPRQNFCPELKTTFFAFKSQAKWIFVVENRFPIRNFCFKWLLKAKNVHFNPGQNFYFGQFQFCPGQKMFCPSRRTRHLLLSKKPPGLFSLQVSDEDNWTTSGNEIHAFKLWHLFLSCNQRGQIQIFCTGYIPTHTRTAAL